jgi:RHS repeat-associated protein
MVTLFSRFAAGNCHSHHLCKGTRFKRRRLLTEALEDRRLLAAVHWISDSDGDWSDAANWQDQTTLANRVPASSDEVLIDRGAANPMITISAGTGRFFNVTSEETIVIAAGGGLGTGDSTFNGLVRIEGGSLFVEGGGAVTLSDVDWTAGSIGGSGSGGGTYTLSGTMTLSGTDDKSLGSALTNNGTIIVGGSGNLNVSTTINNESSAVFDFQSDADFVTSTATFNNRGTLRKSAGVGESALASTTSTQVNHFGGTVEVTSGKLSLAGSDRNHVPEHGATFVVGEGAVLDVTGGSTAYWSGTVTGSGAGRVELSSGTLRTDRIDSTGVIVNLTDDLFHWTGGQLTTSTDEPFVNRGAFQISGTEDKIAGRGAGPVGGIINEGTIRHAGSGSLVPAQFGSPLIHNRAGALYDIQSDVTLVGFDFINEGTLRKSGGGEAAFNGPGHSFTFAGGTVDVQSGRLRIGGDLNADVDTNFHVLPGAVLELFPGGGVFGSGAFFGGATLSGTGGGRVEFTAGGAPNGMRLNFPEGMFHWIGNGVSQVSGAFTNDGFITIEGDGARARAYITNNGTVIQEDGSLFTLLQTSYIVNNGVWDFRGDADLEIVHFSSVGSTFFNFGTLQKSDGLGTSRIFASFGAGSFLSNLGTVDVQSGTLDIHLRSKQFDTQLGDDTLHGGTWRVGPFSTLRFLAADESIPDITMNYGHIILDGVSSEFPNIDNITTNGGTFELQNGRNFSTAGNFANGIERVDIRLDNIALRNEERLIALAVDDATENFYSIRAGQDIRRFTSAGVEILPALPRPDAQPDSFSDLDVSSVPLNIGGTQVPADSLIYISGQVTPPIVYALDKETGQQLATVELPDVPVTTPGIAVHPTRGTLFILNQSGDIHEVNPSNGTIVNTFTVRPAAAPLPFDVFWGDLDVVAATGNLYVVANGLGVGSTQQILRELTPTGEFVRDVDLSHSGISNINSRFNPAGISVNETTGDIWIQNEHSTIARLKPFEFGTFGTTTLGPGSTLTVNGDFTDISTDTVNIQIGGRPASGDFGKLEITGTADLSAGRLNVESVNGFGPTQGDVYEIVTYAQRTGEIGEISGLDPFFSAAVNPTNVLLNGELTFVTGDLDVDESAFTVPNTATPGQQTTIGYSVSNLFDQSIVGPWTDSIYLSRDTVFSTDDVLLARIKHVGGIEALGSYSETVDAVMPAVPEAAYHVIVIADSRGNVPDTDRGNNRGASTVRVESQVTNIVFDTPVDSTVASGQGVYYRLDVPGGGDLVIEGNFAKATQAEILVSYESLPTRTNFDFAVSSLQELERQISIPSPQAGRWYVLVHGLAPAGSGQPFSLTTSLTTFGLDSVSPTRGSTAGKVTTTISGTGFSPDSEVRLVDPVGNVVATAMTQFADINTLYATFDLAGVVIGSYDVSLVDAASESLLTDAFEVTDGPRAELEVQLIAPGAVRRNRGGMGSVVFTNVGETDLVAPLFSLTSNNAPIRLEEQEFFSNSLLFVGISSEGPAGILPPGGSGEIPIIIGPSGNYELTLQQITLPRAPLIDKDADPPASLDVQWNSLVPLVKPELMPDDAWEVVSANLRSEVGATFADLESVLAENATYLGSIGQRTADFTQLFGFEMLQADGFGEISRRFAVGALGRGFNDPTDIDLFEAADGSVTIGQHNVLRFFDLRPDGSYVGGNGDPGQLVRTGDHFEILDLDGRRTSFHSDGRFDFVEDANRNRTTATYDANNRLVEVSYPDTDTVTYTYNSQGRIVKTTDTFGLTATFQYDSSDQHLVGMTTPEGTTTYSYFLGEGAVREHAIKSITHPDGAVENYSYDNLGRLASVSLAGGEDRLTYTYDSTGGRFISNADDETTRQQLNRYGQVAQVTTAIGNTYRYETDDDFNTTAVIGPEGFRFTYVYDDFGNLLAQTDPLGADTEFGYVDGSNLIDTVRNARDSFTRVEYDVGNNATRNVYNDGSFETFTYDSQGRLATYTNRRDQTLTLTYNDRDLVSRKTLDDGSTIDYEYNALGSLTKITDSAGETVYQYDAAGRLTQITDPDNRTFTREYAGGRISKLIYPNGLELRYVYDAVGRLSQITDASDNDLVSYSFDSLGLLASTQFSSGASSEFDYDADGNLSRIIHRDMSDAILQQYDYVRNGLGLTTEVQSNKGTTAYTYDTSGQLTQVVLPDSRTIVYEYDATGNRIAVTDDGTITSYVVDALNQYEQVGTADVEHDLDGNLTRIADGTTVSSFAYDQQNQLVSASLPDGVWQFEYDGSGILTAVVHDGSRTELLVDPTQVNLRPLAQYDDADNLVSSFAYGYWLAATFDPTGAPTFVGTNARGDVTVTTDAAGDVVTQSQYLPFGAPTSPAIGGSDLFGYGGSYGVQNFGTEIYRVGARWYHPGLGRFLTPDPIRFASNDDNFYRYVGNSPIDSIDPSGLNNQFWVPQGGPTGPSYQPASSYGNLRPAGLAPSTPTPTPPANTPVRTPTPRPTVRPISTTGPAAQRIGAGFLQGVSRVATPLLITATVAQVVAWAGSPLVEAYYGQGEDFAAISGDRVRERCRANPDACREIIRRVRERSGSDPNEIIGPNGHAEPGFIQSDAAFDYTIHFENLQTANDSPQEVVITHQLDSDLDLSTFEFSDVGFGDFRAEVPAGLQVLDVRVDARQQFGVFVDITGELELATGMVTWRFLTIDPATGDFTADPFAGFLPPNNNPPEGDGFVSYGARPAAGLPDGTEIDAQATIVFDFNPPLDTNVHLNTVDDTAPSSSVTPLDEAYGKANFMVEWTGQDDSGGSGIAKYDIYVATNDGPFELLLAGTTEMSHEFTGESGSTYAFISRAHDNVGLIEASPSAADTETLVIIGAWVNRDDVYDVNARDGVTVLDALTVINELASRLVSDAVTAVLIPLPPSEFPPPFYDVNEDGKATALDALRVINQLARLVSAQQESVGEAEVAAAPPPPTIVPTIHSSIDRQPARHEQDHRLPAPSKRAQEFNLSAVTEITDRGVVTLKQTLEESDNRAPIGLDGVINTLAADVARQWDMLHAG